MSRQFYPLTDSTRKALNGNIAEIADEMDCDPSYLYQICSSTVSDPWGSFRRLYRAVKRRGGDVSGYRIELDAIDADADKPKPHCSPVECLTNKLLAATETACQMAQALEDGHIDEAESMAILQAVAKEREQLDLIELRMQYSPVKAFAINAVNGRRNK